MAANDRPGPAREDRANFEAPAWLDANEQGRKTYRSLARRAALIAWWTWTILPVSPWQQRESLEPASDRLRNQRSFSDLSVIAQVEVKDGTGR
jgi:hypothetical protein